MTGDRIDHAAEALRLFEEKPAGKGYWSHAEAHQHAALCGIGHALLAIHEALTNKPTVSVTPPSEETVVDLMQALEDSIAAAKASRDRLVAAKEPEPDHGCG